MLSLLSVTFTNFTVITPVTYPAATNTIIFSALFLTPGTVASVLIVKNDFKFNSLSQT